MMDSEIFEDYEAETRQYKRQLILVVVVILVFITMVLIVPGESQPKVEWLDGVRFHSEKMKKDFQIGFKEDGTVVWRPWKKEYDNYISILSASSDSVSPELEISSIK